MKGFNNIGNTCYLNSGLQLILHNYDLCNIIIKNNNKSKILNDIAELIGKYYSNYNQESLDPSIIKNMVEQKNDMFKGFMQHDSSEFIIYFLNLINDEINIDFLYEIKTKISIKCKLRSCLNISSHEEKNNFLILDIKNEFTNIDECFADSNARYKFDNDNLYWCDKCNDKRIASKRIKIIDYPKHLIVILKRFTKTNDRITKNTNPIFVPEFWLDKYVLKGIVYHSGNTHGGHYIYIGKYNEIWHMFNDNYVNKINNLDEYKNFGYVYYFEKI